MEKSPDAFRTISEVAETLGTPAHVLRFWESRFPQVRPVKRAGGRRYYRPSDVALLAGIRQLLHEEGLTIRGVQKILREQGVRHVAALGGLLAPASMDQDIEAALVAELDRGAGMPAQEAAPEAVQTAQVIPLGAALARAEAREVEAPAAAAETAAEVPEAPFTEAEEETPPAPPVPLHGEAAAPGDGAEDAEPAATPTEATPVALRLRQVDPARLAGRQAELAALRARLADLRGRLAQGVRRRAR